MVINRTNSSQFLRKVEKIQALLKLGALTYILSIGLSLTLRYDHGQNEILELNTTISIITLNVSGLNKSMEKRKKWPKESKIIAFCF